MKRLQSVCRVVALILALTDGAGRAQEYFDNVVIVLDASGSMKQSLPGSGMNKMDAAKSALKSVLQTAPQSTHIGLLVFSAANLKDDWAYPLGPRNDAVLINAIDSIEASSGTPLGEYIKKGADRLLQERAKQFGYGSYRLLVVTDGEAQDQNLVERYTPEVMSRGVTMDVIGVGMKSDHTLARKVHSYRRANDPASLKRAVREAFAEIAGTATDTAQADAFELLAPVPNEVAAAMIQALSSSGNHPIGARPALAPRPQTTAPSSNPQAGAPAQPSPAPAATPSRKKLPLWPIIFFVFFLSFFLRRAKKGVRR
jgi:von Willebrand factor type A domain